MHWSRSLRQRLVGVLGSAVCLAVLSACASAESAEPGLDGVRSGAPSSSSGTAVPERAHADLVIWSAQESVDVLTSVAEEFAGRNDVTVAVQGIPGDRLTAFLAANAAGTGPDVLVGPHDWIGTMVQNGAVEPLRLTETDQQRYSPIALDGVTYSDTIYGLPYAYETVALFRNTALVDKAPTTVEELGAVAAASGADNALCLPVGTDGDAYHLQPLYSSAGGYLFGATSDGGYNVTDLGVGKEGSLVAAEKLAELGASGVLKTSITEENSLAMFISGECAFLQSGPWVLDDLRSAGISYALTPMVGFAGMQPAQPFTGVRAFYVATKGQSNELARRFVLDAANSPEAIRAMYDNEHRPPAMTQVLEEVKVTDPEMQVFADAASAGKILPAIPQVTEVWGPLGQAEAAIIDGADPVSTMLSAGARISEQTS